MWRVLVVDDEPDVRAVIAATLKTHFEVVEALDGLDALEKIERAEPDFVVMDVSMPNMDGFQACDAIRKNARFAETPVMFLSALSSKDDIKKGYGVGANLYLTKPFDPTRLLRNINLFFETNQVQPKPKRYSLARLKEAEQAGLAPVAPGAAEFEHAPGMAPAAPEDRTTTLVNVADLAKSTPTIPRVLVVDDDTNILQIMEMTLANTAETVVASDGISAIEKLVKYQPDILVIDVMLPKMSGYQLCQSLRSNPAFRTLPIIVCSAKSADRDVQLAKRMGASDFLGKPFNPADLIGKVREACRQPGFRIRPKSLSIEEIRAREAPKAAETFSADADARAFDERQRTGTPPSQSSAKQVGDFLKREGDKDPLTKGGAGQNDPAKRKRRLFGFGGSDE